MVLEGNGFKHGFYMVFGLFSLSFPMDFHGEGFWEIPYSSQSLTVASQRVPSNSGTKAECPTDQSFPF